MGNAKMKYPSTAGAASMTIGENWPDKLGLLVIAQQTASAELHK